MDRVDLLATIEQTAAIVRIYREEVMEPEASSSMAEGGSLNMAEDASLIRVVRNLHEELIVLLLPGGKPCSRCNGSGVDP